MKHGKNQKKSQTFFLNITVSVIFICYNASASECRLRILQALLKRRKESMEVFATEFQVSYMTIFRDVQFLSCYFPIVTKRGIRGTRSGNGAQNL